MAQEAWNLSGKRALLTADSRGWAPFLAAALAEAGAHVAVVGPQREAVAAAARTVVEHGRRAQEVVADLTRAPAVRRVVQGVVGQWGSLDILVNHAQARLAKPFLEVTKAEWDTLLAVNVRSLFLLCQEAGQQMLRQERGGRIINVISGLAERGVGNSVAYCASQGAALQLTRALALEWARTNIRVNAIATGWFSLDAPSAEQTALEPLSRFIPQRRLGHPSELAALLVYLASDACDFVTGQAIVVDGGAMAHG